MAFLTVKEAAAKWGISPRLAQQYCTAGRIKGAQKFGNSWAIPDTAPKPEDPRKAAGDTKNEHKPKTVSPARMPMPLLNTPFKPGHCKAALRHIHDADSRAMATAEYYYFSGQAEQASDIAQNYLTHEDMALRLSACWIYGYSNLALNRLHNTRQVLDAVNRFAGAAREKLPPAQHAMLVCISTAAKVLLHLPLEENAQPVMEVLAQLPPGLRLFALYVQAHQAYLQKAYGASIGMVETALALEGDTYPIPTVYLHMVATMDYMSLRMPDKAREHLLAAWKLAQPDDLIEPFGEHHGLLGGMLEAVIKKDYPDDFKRMINITYSFSAGWRKIHNPSTGRSVADNLTTTEFAAAMLAARDWSNKEIAAHMGLSENTVKTYIATALQKLNISQRKELRNFMLH